MKVLVLIGIFFGYIQIAYAISCNATNFNQFIWKPGVHDCILKDVDLRYADLRGANFIAADLTGANLRGVNLSEAKLNDAIVSFADLTGANLVGANFSHANLRSTTFRNADLRGCDFTGANMKFVTLYGTTLSGWFGSNSAIFSNTKLDRRTREYLVHRCVDFVGLCFKLNRKK